MLVPSQYAFVPDGFVEPPQLLYDVWGVVYPGELDMPVPEAGPVSVAFWEKHADKPRPIVSGDVPAEDLEAVRDEINERCRSHRDHDVECRRTILDAIDRDCLHLKVRDQELQEWRTVPPRYFKDARRAAGTIRTGIVDSSNHAFAEWRSFHGHRCYIPKHEAEAFLTSLARSAVEGEGAKMWDVQENPVFGLFVPEGYLSLFDLHRKIEDILYPGWRTKRFPAKDAMAWKRARWRMELRKARVAKKKTSLLASGELSVFVVSPDGKRKEKLPTKFWDWPQSCSTLQTGVYSSNGLPYVDFKHYEGWRCVIREGDVQRVLEKLRQESRRNGSGHDASLAEPEFPQQKEGRGPGRPPKSGSIGSDEWCLDAMRDLQQRGVANSLSAAAGRLVRCDLVGGHGSEESRIKRLVRKFRKRYPDFHTKDT